VSCERYEWLIEKNLEKKLELPSRYVSGQMGKSQKSAQRSELSI
jgi:hypothetical protein